MRGFHYTIATVFGTGYLPLAPGTGGALFGVLIYLLLMRGNPLLFWGLIIIVFLVGTLSANFLTKDRQDSDPSIVVIDEVAGMWVGLSGAADHSWWSAFIAFALFRFFDIVKPYPIKNIERLPGGLGIMLDDILAGIYTLIVTHLIIYWIV